MTVRINRKNVLYFILVSAFLNPILRLSPGSNITLFRVLLPVSVGLILACSTKYFKQLCAAVFILAGYGLIQHYITSTRFYPKVGFSVRYYLEYLFHYSSIIVVLFIIRAIRAEDEEAFFDEFSRFMRLFAKCIAAFLLIYTVILRRPLYTLVLADNINNMGCLLAASIPFLLLENGLGNYKNWFWSLLIVFLLYYNDSKAAMMGAMVEILLFCALIDGKGSIERGILIARRGLYILEIMAVALVFMYNPSINGYSLNDIVLGTIRRVITNTPYDYANTSISYRTNSTLAAFNIIRRTHGLGVGFGNTARVLKATMEGVYERWALSAGYSLHNSWLELMCDFGIPAIIAELFAFLTQLKNAVCTEFITNREKCVIVLFLSLPIWSIGASGLLTEFYTLSTIMFFAMFFKDKSASNRLVFDFS